MTGPDSHEQGGLPRAYLRPCLLILLAEGACHGYELLEQVRRLGVRGAEAGSLYRVLRVMEREGQVTSWWETSRTGPARRTYVLSDSGRAELKASVAALRDVQRLLTSLLDRHDARAGRAGSDRPT